MNPNDPRNDPQSGYRPDMDSYPEFDFDVHDIPPLAGWGVPIVAVFGALATFLLIVIVALT